MTVPPYWLRKQSSNFTNSNLSTSGTSVFRKTSERSKTSTPENRLLTEYLYPISSSRAGCDKRSMFKRENASLNSEFPFSHTSYHTKFKVTNQPYDLPFSGRRFIVFMTFLGALERSETHSVQDLNSILF